MIRFSFLKDNTDCLVENRLKAFNDNQEVILEADGSNKVKGAVWYYHRLVAEEIRV